MNAAIATLARLASVKAVKLRLHRQGLKPQHIARRVILGMAEKYLAEHRAELIAEATERVVLWQACAALERFAQKSKARKTGTSVVHISGAK
jgi:hypothetical protein